MAYKKNEATMARTDARRKTFLVAARRLWDLHGLQGFSMADVAREAGSSVGNLYFYFPDRDALLSKVVEDGLLLLHQAIEAAMEGSGRIHYRLAMALLSGIRGFLEDPSLCSLCFGHGLPQAVETVVKEFLANRLLRFIQVRGERHYTASFSVNCWYGSIRDSLRSVMNGTLLADATLLTKYLVRWNFLALGLDKSTVQRVLEGLPQGEL